MSNLLRINVLYGYTVIRPESFASIGHETLDEDKPVRYSCGYCLSVHDETKCPNCGAPKQ